MDKVIIGGGQGFWGDSNDAAIHMVHTAPLDYMACDYLAELTMSILARQKIKNPAAGFARDFLGLYKACGEEAFRKNIGILTNAGGMNIEGCVDGVKQIAEEKGLHGLKIGYVTGDDLTADIPRLLAEGVDFKNIDDVGDFNEVKDKIFNANVYFGHEPTLACLEQGGERRHHRPLDRLCPLPRPGDVQDGLGGGRLGQPRPRHHGRAPAGMRRPGRRRQLYVRLAGRPADDELGFPIAELTPDTFEITKAPDCGGIICEQSCKEQFLYEVHDPANYVTPDVVVDISNATLTQQGENRVRVGNVRGKARPDTLKLSIGYHAGYKVAGMLSFAWPDAYEKATTPPKSS